MNQQSLSHEIKRAAEVLGQLLDEDQLEGLVHELDIYLPFQAMVCDLEGPARASVFTQLIAGGLGIGLLGHSALRNMIESHLGCDHSSTWKPGSISASRLCELSGLPAIFAGDYSVSTRTPLTLISSAPDALNLLDYQAELVASAMGRILENKSSLMSIPTGGGKTVVASQILAEVARAEHCHVFNWIAHTDELCEQAILTVSKVWRSSHNLPTLRIFRFWGPHSRAAKMIGLQGSRNERRGRNIDLIISTPQSFLSLIRKLDDHSEIRGALRARTVTVVDEAHRAGASTYQEIASRLAALSAGEDPILLGLSATPMRESFSQRVVYHSGILKRLFGALIEPIKAVGQSKYTEYLRELGVLATPVFSYTRNTSFKSRAEYILEVVSKKRSNGVSLVFCSSVQGSTALAAYLTGCGVSALSVTAQTPAHERAVATDMLASGQLAVISNCEILTTGFDCPAINDIFIMRETNSPVLYSQMIGRGLRGPRFGGAQTCNVHLLGVGVPFMDDIASEAVMKQIWGNQKS